MKRRRRKRRRRLSLLGKALLGMMAASLALLGAGAWKLLSLERTLTEGAERAQTLLIRSAREDSGTVIQGRASAEDAIGVLTFRGEAGTATPIYYGTTAEVLERGVGQAEETAALNEPGNAVLFGHRDSAFRALEHLREGDAVTLQTVEGVRDYTVERVYITHPEDPHIYDPSEEPTLTMVTCYPFSFVGPAPERCVVIAKANAAV